MKKYEVTTYYTTYKVEYVEALDEKGAYAATDINKWTPSSNDELIENLREQECIVIEVKEEDA